MVTRSKLTAELFEELVDVINSTYNVENPYKHVDHKDADNETLYPSLHFYTQAEPIKRGLDGGETYVEDVVYDANGSVDHILLKRVYTLFFDIIASSTNDNEQRKDELYEAVEAHFLQFTTPFRSLDDIHTDVKALGIDGSDDVDHSATAIRADGTTIELMYEKYIIEDRFDTIESIDIELYSEGELTNYEF